MALKYRVGRLEVHARASTPVLCPECGTGPGAPIELKVIPGLVVRHIGENAAHEPQPSDLVPALPPEAGAPHPAARPRQGGVVSGVRVG